MCRSRVIIINPARRRVFVAYGFPLRLPSRDQWHRRIAGPNSLGDGNGNANPSHPKRLINALVYVPELHPRTILL